MPNEDYNANFDELTRVNLKKIYSLDPQCMTGNDFIGLNGEPYIHTIELIRDLEELHFIENEYDENIYYLTDRGYLFLEQEGLAYAANDSNTDELVPKKKSRIVEIFIVIIGAAAVLYAASIYMNYKSNSENPSTNIEIVE